MSFWDRLPFAGRLLVTASVALLVAGLVMVSSSARQEAEDARLDLHNALIQELEALPAAMDEPVVVGDFSTIQQILDRYAQRPEVVEIGFETPHGTMLKSRGQTYQAKAPQWFQSAFHYDSVTGKKPLDVGGVSYGQLELTLSPCVLADRAWRSLLNHMGILLLAVSIDCLGIWLVLHFGLRPLNELGLAVEKIAEGQLSLRIPVQGSPEFAQLIDRFNRMAHAIESANAQLRQLSIDSTLAEERERQAIARDLHDDIGQLLHIAKLKLGMLNAQNLGEEATVLLAELKQVVGDTSTRVRSLTAQLSPPVLEKLGLVPACHWLADEMHRIYGLAVEIDDDGQPKPLTPVQATILFRSIRELLINVVKHAGVRYADLQLSVVGQALVIEVADHGSGVKDAGGVPARSSGFGLASIRERIGYLGGEMRVTSQPGRGTAVVLSLPLMNSNEVTGNA